MDLKSPPVSARWMAGFVLQRKLSWFSCSGSTNSRGVTTFQVLNKHCSSVVTHESCPFQSGNEIVLAG